MNIILLGPPGAGKGTAAGNIKSRFGLMHLSTGDLLRSEIAKGTELGTVAKELIDKGMLVPDDMIIGMVSELLAETGGQGIMFDGFPRTVAQAEALDKIAKINVALCLTADEDVVTARICSRRVCPKCGAVYSTLTMKGDSCIHCGGELIQRADDTEETARERFEVYIQKTQPLVDYYKKAGILRTIDANREVGKVTADVLKALEDIVKWSY